MTTHRYRLTITYIGGGDAIRSLRLLLKHLLRAWRWRCVQIEELTPPIVNRSPSDCQPLHGGDKP